MKALSFFNKNFHIKSRNFMNIRLHKMRRKFLLLLNLKKKKKTKGYISLYNLSLINLFLFPSCTRIAQFFYFKEKDKKESLLKHIIFLEFI